jgi:hypothetical protein
MSAQQGSQREFKGSIERYPLIRRFRQSSPLHGEDSLRLELGPRNLHASYIRGYAPHGCNRGILILQHLFDALSAAWQDQALRAAIVSAVLTALFAAIERAVRPKSRMVWAVSHQYFFNAKAKDGSELPLRTRHIWFQNTGRNKADNVRITLNFGVPHMEVWPPMHYSVQILDDGRPCLIFDSIAPHETFTLSMIADVTELPDVLYVKSDSGAAKRISMAPQRVYPRWVNLLATTFLVIGAFTSVYMAIRFLQLLTG